MKATWALIPARGGSKSIPMKNLAMLGGYSLLDYSIRSSLKSDVFQRIICSTDNEDISKKAKAHGIEVEKRPSSLGQDTSRIEDVIKYHFDGSGVKPELLAIVEPTSPFIRDVDIKNLLSKLQSDDNAMSAQTISRPFHTHSAINQRQFTGNYVSYLDKNRHLYSHKQEKPRQYIFGNLAICRLENILSGGSVLDEPSIGLEIEWPYSLNIDSPEELLMGNALIAYGIVDTQSLLGTN